MADRWFTYQELGEVLGCSAVAARARAQRARWRRQTGNDGLARVLLPDGAEMHPVRTRNTRPSAPEAHARTPGVTESELLTRLTALQTELAEMARKLGAAEERAEGLQAILDVERRQASELRQDRDRAFEQLEQAQTAHVAELTALHERMAKAEHDRDQALERLNLNIDRLDRVQDEHRAEITVVRDQLAQAQSDRDRAVEALAAHLALPWWRRLFG